jgi:hypothetical protein
VVVVVDGFVVAVVELEEEVDVEDDGVEDAVEAGLEELEVTFATEKPSTPFPLTWPEEVSDTNVYSGIAL